MSIIKTGTHLIINNMRCYNPVFCFLILMYSCGELSPETKREIKQTGKEIAKQVTATAEHLDFTHAYIGYEAMPDSSDIRMYWKDDKGNILGSCV